MGNCDNPKTGADFERLIQVFFARQGVALQPNFVVPIGVASEKRGRKFDLGSADPPILVECKCHTWTSGGNAPSAKLTVWNEAMYYFHAAPSTYRRILFVRHSVRGTLTLGEHYVRRYSHLIPAGVELWELDPISEVGRCLYGSPPG